MSYDNKITFWLRLFNIGFGLLNAVIAFYLLVNYEVAILTILIFFIAILMLSGFIRTMNGLFDRSESRNLRIVNVILGVLVLFLGFYILIDPGLGVDLIILLLAFALLLTGIARIIVGFGENFFPTWARIILIIVGLISVIVSFYILISPTVAVEILVLLLALGFLFNGIGRIITGITGRKEATY